MQNLNQIKNESNLHSDSESENDLLFDSLDINDNNNCSKKELIEIIKIQE